MASTNQKAQLQHSQLLNQYERLPRVSDELFNADGSIRTVWLPLLDYFSSLGPGEIAKRFGRGDQYLRDAGVFFRQASDEHFFGREWPLSQTPVLIHENEWRSISNGLVQRADLLENIVRDLYGPNKLVADGHLPASLIAKSEEWLRPLVGVKPPDGNFLSFIAFDIGRGPDGQWWVLGNRTQAPAGAGFALENRLAMTRSYSDFIRHTNLHRLAGFFRIFRDTLYDMRQETTSRAGILTPGPETGSYYEQAYIAQYLGMMLLEGDDLTVENNKLMVRTISGLQPISVLWRRLRSSDSDPLELDEDSSEGTPGFLTAVRAGSISLVNALGTGILDIRGLQAFLPQLSQALHNQPLALPNIATWWCGHPDQLAFVRENAQKMAIGSAYSTRLPYKVDENTAIGGEFPGDPARSVDAWLCQNSVDLAAQELATLSTTPVYEDGKLVPRPLSVRVFLARQGDGWTVMPGGFARIGMSSNPYAVGLNEGGSSADVWIVSDNPVVEDTMLPDASSPHIRKQPTILPSRAAENLFWLGRYVERVENLVRLSRAYHTRLAEARDPHAPLLLALRNLLAAYNIDPDVSLVQNLEQAMLAAVGSASQIRYRFSRDGWAALSEIAGMLKSMNRGTPPGEDTASQMGQILQKITGFSGLLHDNMYRFNGWRFLTIGRSLERAAIMTRILAAFGSINAPEGSYDLALELGDSTMSYRRRYSITTSRESVIDMLALDEQNPRSIQYHLSEILRQVEALSPSEQQAHKSDLSRAILRLHTSVSVSLPEEIDLESLDRLGKNIDGLHDHLNASYLK